MIASPAPAVRRRSDVRAAVLLVIASFLLLGCGLRAPAAQAATPVMPLGDSITDGYNIPGGYRIDLEDRMIAAGSAVDFVGSLSNGPSALADREHEGHSGWRIDEIAGSASAWLATSKPQVVLLLIGTNDVIQNYALSTAPQRLSALVDQVVAGAPSATVLVSSLPPLADAAREQNVRAYNAAIPGIVDEKVAQGKRVRFVDMHPELTTAHLADGVHPNSAGYSRMAAVWEAALRPVLSANAAPSVRLSAPAADASYTAPASVALAAAASDSDGTVARVEFRSGSTLLATDTTAPFEHSWSGVAAGTYSVTARAVDDGGAATTSAPVTVTVRDAAGTTRAFLRGVNLAGSAVTIDGNAWQGSTAANYRHNGASFANQSVALTPSTDTARATMIRSSVYSRSLAIDLLAVAAGDYDVFLYVWEDNFTQTYDVAVEGRVVAPGFVSGGAGSWRKLGPYPVSPTDGTVSITTSGGDANVSGIELWRRGTAEPAPPPPNAAPTVAMSAPAAGASFTAPASIPLAATASDSDGTVARVEFLSGSTVLATDTTAPFGHTWSGVPAGTYSVTARAIDDKGAATTSAARSVTVSAPPSAGSSFYRAVNLAGSALTLDGNAWQGSTAPNYRHNGTPFASQGVALTPATDTARATMIRSSVYSRALSIDLTAVPTGDYDVYLYAWEDNFTQTYDIAVEGRVVAPGFVSGSAGAWKKLGPYPVSPTDGTVSITTAGGDANISGVELWRRGL